MFRLLCGDTESIRVRPWLTAVMLVLGSLYALPASAFEHYTAHGGPVKGLALSPDGEYLFFLEEGICWMEAWFINDLKPEYLK